MAQLNMHLTPEFEDSLATFMRVRGLRTKSEAIRVAVREGLQRALQQTRTTDFAAMRGLATAVPENPDRRFRDEDELWG